ncbi:VWA domain-containing protein [Bacillus cereus]|uniref:von Willebrand factor type A domain protein n=1 Tax=Bacillus mobilis TaxID=2026190 RepID=A0A1Y5Z2Z1_9BACI|nr:MULTISPECIES: VWA domain-containing protein [Bacillus cereus group]MBL3741161.1 VWA domain-containing protein [Bacillus cereus]MBL3863813.1 VWA domain-containing protein [Bacillus cereus]SMD77881.1 von Willebrand factor type A domain protein [Bacillus mobilis]
MGKALFNVIGITLGLCVFITACSKSDTTSSKSNEPKSEVVEKEISKKELEKEDIKTYESLFATNAPLMTQEGPGKYAKERALSSEEMNELNQELIKLPKDLSAEQIYVQLLNLQAQSYKEAVSKLERIIPELAIKEQNNDNVNSIKPKEKSLNVEILLDASGSMAGKVNGQVKMEVAKKAIYNYLDKIPDNANVMLRVYGHKGSNNENDKSLSCGSSEVMYPLQPYKKEQFNAALSNFGPKGWTPLAAAIESVNDDFKEYTGEESLNVVYIVSDGEETCGGDPVNAAKNLNQSNTHAVVNIIGFDVKNSEQQQLKNTAEAGKGNYATVSTADELYQTLNTEYEKLYKEWENWKIDQYFSLNTQWSDLFMNIKKAHMEINDVINKEHYNLKNNISYLSEKEIIDNNKKISLEKLIKLRFDTLTSYYNDREKELINLITENEKKMKQHLDQSKP